MIKIVIQFEKSLETKYFNILLPLVKVVKETETGK